MAKAGCLAVGPNLLSVTIACCVQASDLKPRHASLKLSGSCEFACEPDLVRWNTKFMFLGRLAVGATVSAGTRAPATSCSASRGAAVLAWVTVGAIGTWFGL